MSRYRRKGPRDSRQYPERKKGLRPWPYQSLCSNERGFRNVPRKLENIEQYNRRDCLLFFGLVECEGENCTDKIVETAHAMGVSITHFDESISHRLFTRNRRPGKPRAVIAKFTRRDTKNAIYQSKHRLKLSDNHYNVYVREQLTKERARTLFWLKEEGYEVTTYECRLLYKKGPSNGVINSLDELITKIGWESGKLKKSFQQIAIKRGPHPK